jgi:hypothetical protein
MFNNSYYNQPYTYGQTYAQNYTPTIQRPVQPIQQDSPFGVVRFGTLDEAKAQLVPPARASMFIKSDFSEIYVKSADAMGNSALEVFKCSRVDENTTQAVSPVLDPKEFVKTDDLKDVVRKDDLKGLLSVNEVTNFVTKDDIKGLSDKVEQMQRQIKSIAILKGGDENE